jgi:hypothetical protein
MRRALQNIRFKSVMFCTGRLINARAVKNSANGTDQKKTALLLLEPN